MKSFALVVLSFALASPNALAMGKRRIENPIGPKETMKALLQRVQANDLDGARELLADSALKAFGSEEGLRSLNERYNESKSLKLKTKLTLETHVDGGLVNFRAYEVTLSGKSAGGERNELEHAMVECKVTWDVQMVPGELECVGGYYPVPRRGRHYPGYGHPCYVGLPRQELVDTEKCQVTELD